MVDVIEKNATVTFRVRVQPRSSRSEIAGERDGAIRIRVVSPPVDGRANEECRRLIAKLIGVAPSAVEIVSGDSSRDKVIRVHDVDAARVREAIGRT